MKNGILSGIAAYALWGFFPIYWKLLHDVPAPELLGHRIVWSYLLLLVVIFVTRQWTVFRSQINTRTIRLYLLAALLIGVNWLTYVWAVNAGYIVETSLGYFINPLLSVLLGVMFLRERLRPAQWLPVMLAAIGVGYVAFAYGRLPWIALLLAFSFGFYGLTKKLAPLGSVFGLALETGILFLPAVIYLGWIGVTRSAVFLHESRSIDVLLVGAGLVTTVPLLMFATAAKQIPLASVGILQYLAPTIQFLIGVFLYHEPFDRSHLIGFGFVWLALIIFWLESFMATRMKPELVTGLERGG